MRKQIYYYLIYIVSGTLIGCNSTNNQNSVEMELLKKRNDSLQNILRERAVAPLPPSKDTLISRSFIYVYTIIKYVIITVDYQPRKAVTLPKFNSYSGQTEEVEIRPAGWDEKEIETPYVHFSKVGQYPEITEDLKYQLLDEMERSIRTGNINTRIRIISRELKIYSSYADASKSIEEFKRANNLSSVGLSE